MSDSIRLIDPHPASTESVLQALGAMEQRGIYSNFGPANTRFEEAVVSDLIRGARMGGAVTVCNATMGLILSIRQATLAQPSRRRFALMPSFTFAATAQAALWCGLTPLLCDIDPETWLACPDEERGLLERFGDEVAVIIACTTFGNPIDLARYRELAATFGCAVVVDAAAALGTEMTDHAHFGADSAFPVVFSMHATKAFATHEGGLIYDTDPARLAALRAMTNFGFVTPRSAALPGLNAKLSEIVAIYALAKLSEFPRIVSRRWKMEVLYRSLLPELEFQKILAARYAPVMASVLLPRALAPQRAAIRHAMASDGVGTGSYFSPHLAQQPYLQANCVFGRLPVCDDVSSRILSLPLTDQLSDSGVLAVADALQNAIRTCTKVSVVRTSESDLEV